MKERGIIFSGSMVKAILDDRKTMTRRVVKPQPTSVRLDKYDLWETKGWLNIPQKICRGPIWIPTSNSGKVGIFEKPYYLCPYGVPGDRLYVRETTWRNGGYVATDVESIMNDGKVPSIHMPKKFARIWLEIVSVRVERVQEISEKDARAEGIEATWNTAPTFDTNYITPFADLWDSLNAKRGYPWADEDLPENLRTEHGRIMYGNPWVWVIEFKRTT